MRRRVLAIALALATVLSLIGCGKATGKSTEISNDKITIKKYKGLEIEVEDYAVTDEEVEMSIQSTLQTLSTRKEITDRPAQKGDAVTIDYEGKLDGVAFEGGTAKGTVIEPLGEANYVPGFQEGIIGQKVGETFYVPVTFPEDYYEDLAGKEVVFTITIHKIEEVTVPELTEDLLPKIGTAAKTIEEYKAQVKQDLEKSNKETVESSIEGLVWEALVEQCVVKAYPQDEVDEFLSYVDTQLAEVAKENKTTPAEYFEQYYQMTPEKYIKNTIKVKYAIELIAEKEKLTLTAKEYEDGLAEAAENAGVTDVKEYEKQVGGREAIELQLLQPKVSKILIDNAKRVAPKTEK